MAGKYRTGRKVADIEETELDGDFGLVDGVRATCRDCGHETESFGTGEKSRLRCLWLLNIECKKNENNKYIDADADRTPRWSK